MKKVLISFILFFSQFIWSFEYPKIISWSGEPIVEYKKQDVSKKAEDKFSQAHTVILKKNYEFKSPFAVVTASKDFLKLGIGSASALEILPKSKMQMPYVHAPAEDEDVKLMTQHILLLDGHYRYKSEKKMDSIVKIETAFFNLVMPQGLELIIDLDMKIPAVALTVIAGSLNVNYYDHESKVTLKPNQKVTFVGVKNSEGVVLYDYLLDRRKAPKGKLGAVQKISTKEAYKHLQEYLAAEEKRQKAEALEKNKKIKARNHVYICQQPQGKLNQCYWKMLDGICYRFRCNASGEWSDKTERSFSDLLSNQQCRSNKGVATTCDY